MELLQIENISKVFGGNKALNNINLSIEPGEVHALVGENGAGKSTLIKILTGVYSPTEGNLYWQGKQVKVESPKEAQELGINVIHQDRQLISYFTGLENLYLNTKYPKKLLGINWAKMKKEANSLLEKWGMDIPLSIPVSEMTPSERTMLEIARSMMSNSKLLILDEPTASLTDKESELLFQFIGRLKNEGVAIIYISHRLEEVMNLSDRVTILMGGKLMRTLTKEEVTQERLIYYMTDGQETTEKSARTKPPVGKSLLKVKDLRTVDHTVKQVSFELNEGEIVGVYGLAGSGRTETMEAIYGLRKIESGSVELFQQTVSNPTPSYAINHGVVLIPENRHEDALIMSNTIAENISLPILHKITKNGILNKKEEDQLITREMKRFQVKAVDKNQTVGELSGGNQQKVVFAKALLSEPSIYICDEPTQAVDIMTRIEIHEFLRGQVNENKGVIYVSSDLHEILEISDRIVVFSEGKTVANLPNKNLKPDDILDICYSFHKEVINE
ncbi:sugar ABC transporter ATP-binding protein [Neobacillus sp. FSL H8-0543]|uniref:sugar ABC transporter ATP-binding protein n=1 Tax=Neobacillus sp. FSL H8-0543 TaxID=2954672 RepID=UPI00315830DC